MKKPHKKAPQPKKGVAGKGTGSATRKAIDAKQKQGLTNKQIGKAANRSAGVISAIDNGVIKNPPKDLAGKIRSAKAPKKKKK